MIVENHQFPPILLFMAAFMNPKKSFEMRHIGLVSPGTLFVPTLLVRCATVQCAGMCSIVTLYNDVPLM